MVEYATVKLWNKDVGVIAWSESQGYGAFEYNPLFLKSGLDISPIHMSLKEAQRGSAIFSFPELRNKTYFGLPGLLADALPDKFGNRVLNAWLAKSGRNPREITPIERLCYIGKRGMGALEFVPGLYPAKLDKSVFLKVADLVDLAQNVMKDRQSLDTQIGPVESENTEALIDLLRVGTSAGGARPKAIIAMNDKGLVKSGQTIAPKGYEYWIVKFDGVTDEELGDPKGYGCIEYAYYLMAKDAGINITECRLLKEGGRSHFMTKRFDRQDGEKIHMLSLCGMAHFDFNKTGAYGYEQAFRVIQSLNLGMPEIEQQYKRTLFNVIGRNQDDHTKNISFLMGRDGQWRLSPAYDITYSYNPDGLWTNQHQMTLNGKQKKFTGKDLILLGKVAGIRDPENIINEILKAVERWPQFAKAAGVKENQAIAIGKSHRLKSISESL